MMTPAEKAKELLDKYWIYLRANLLYDDEAQEDAKHCAIIAVDEILKVASFYNDSQAEVTYWQEVKQELQTI
jgi:hypothetical protein